jgi:site-specific DNA-adenine methylase
MAQYHGGKQRLGANIARRMLSYISAEHPDFEIQAATYCEPFCGMLGVLEHVAPCVAHCLAGDTHASLIKMWQSVQDGWLPEPRWISKEEFMKLKYDKEISATKAFYGHQQSYGGVYFASYCNETQKNVFAGIKRLERIKKVIDNTTFFHGDYTQFTDLKRNIIYCDPPYNGTYSLYFDENRCCKKFDSDAFWSWAHEMSKSNMVFISEYTVPDSFKDNVKTVATFGVGHHSIGRYNKGADSLFYLSPSE